MTYVDVNPWGFAVVVWCSSCMFKKHPSPTTTHCSWFGIFARACIGGACSCKCNPYLAIKYCCGSSRVAEK